MRYWSIPRLVCFFLILGSIIVGPLSAFSSPEVTEETIAIQTEMRDAYETARSLFSYAWDPLAFADPNNKEEISRLVKELSGEFHRIERSSETHQQEPGFALILKAQQEMLEDVSERFSEGKTDYAQWRLKGILQHCAACHSRVAAPYDFATPQSLAKGSTVEQRFGRAELLIASRQFEKAISLFFDIAKENLATRETVPTALQALKQWLVIQVRVKEHWEAAATELERLTVESAVLTPIETEVLKYWVSGLRELSDVSQDTGYQATITHVNELLQPVLATDSLPEQDRHLVSTLRATALLHELLDGKIGEERRRAALLLLAKSYTKLPIVSLDTYSRLYLERCIREHPKTKEAREAYAMLNEQVTLDSSGSGGTHLAEEDRELLEKLRSLAGVE